MADGKKSFILYKSWYEDLKNLSDKDLGILFIAIIKFVNNERPELNKTIEDYYYAITEQIVYEWSKYNPKTQKYHWNYKGGISNENHIIRNSTNLKIWRIKVFERDNYTCQHCKNKGGILNAHHVKFFSEYPELRFDVSNGITLCKECHINEHKRLRHG